MGETLGKRLAALRKRVGLTQVELMERTGIPQTTISGIEHNQVACPRGRTVEKLAAGLGVLPEELTGEPAREPWDGEEELLEAWQELPRSGRLALLATARGLRAIRSSLAELDDQEGQSA